MQVRTSIQYRPINKFEGLHDCLQIKCQPTIGRLLIQYGVEATCAHSPIVWSLDSLKLPRVSELCFMMALLVEMSITNLIEEIEKRPALYKKSLKEYSDANIKKKLWIEVCEEVVPDWNLLSTADKTKEGRDIQKKWANLRTCFRRELNAQKKTKSGQAAAKRRKYIYFEQLLLLLPCIENRHTKGNLEPDDTQEEDDDNDEPGPSTFTPISRRKKRTNAPKQTDVDEPLLKVMKQTNSVDEDTNFALSLVPSLQNLTADEKLDAKIGILNIFKEIRAARRVQTTTKPFSL